MRRTILCLVLFAGIPAGILAQVPAGPEFRISTTGPGDYRFWPRITSDTAGNFVVSWADKVSATQVGTIMARRYDANGVPVAPAFAVSNPALSTGYAAITSDRQGRFAIVWEEQDASNSGIRGRRYDATGAPLGPDFPVNTQTQGDQNQADVASNTAGELFVVWTSEYVDGSSYSVAGRRFDATGAPLGPEFQVNTHTLDEQMTPVVASTGGQNFVVVWESNLQDGSSHGVFAQRYDGTGRVGPEFRVNSYTTGPQGEPAIAADGAGNFVVAWISLQDPSGDFGVYAQRFDAAGNRRGGEFRVNSYTPGDQGIIRVASDPAGNFTVAWQSASQDGDSWGIFGQRFDANGVRRGSEFLVNTGTTSAQVNAAVAVDDAGEFVVAWSSYVPVAATSDIFGQRFASFIPPRPSVDPGGNGVFEPGETVALATSWRNASGGPQTLSGSASNFTGPGAPTDPAYTIVDATADYGTVPAGGTASCNATGNCYAFSIGAVAAGLPVRPALHWDATFREDILPTPLGPPRTHVLHIGDSFTDVPQASPYYRFVETILHLELTGGCGGGNFCPLAATPREQMAVFVVVAKDGAGYQPPACVPGLELFADVPASSPYCRWIEELARRNIAGGCGGGNFCPLGVVSREQMAVFALATKEPPGYSPVPCVPGGERFADVPAASPFCKWIEELARRNIAGGCGGGNFCPVAEVTREQNAVFISGAFALALY
jgi:hypothetical protein